MKNIKKYKLVINRSFYPDILIFPCPAVDCYNRVQGCYVKSFTILHFILLKLRNVQYQGGKLLCKCIVLS